jgi:hypothetical protein
VSVTLLVMLIYLESRPKRPATLLKLARKGTTYPRSLERRRLRSTVKLVLPAALLRLEGAILLLLSVLLYGLSGESWLLFVLLFLVPDLSMLGYLSGRRAGAVSYNLFHTYVLPGLLAAFGLLAGSPLLLSLALVWFSHIGFDRMVGFGLKYPTGFFDTHLRRP